MLLSQSAPTDEKFLFQVLSEYEVLSKGWPLRSPAAHTSYFPVCQTPQLQGTLRKLLFPPATAKDFLRHQHPFSLANRSLCKWQRRKEGFFRGRTVHPLRSAGHIGSRALLHSAALSSTFYRQVNIKPELQLSSMWAGAYFRGVSMLGRWDSSYLWSLFMPFLSLMCKSVWKGSRHICLNTFKSTALCSRRQRVCWVDFLPWIICVT